MCLNAGGMNRLDAESETLLPVQPYTLAVRGRGDSHQLEYRQDGTANALLTPNGGRAGIGVGAIAFNARQDPDCWQDRTGPLDTSGFTQAVGTDCYNGAITGDVAATMGSPGSSVNASGPTVMQPVVFTGGVDYENNAHTPDEPTGPLLKGSPTGGGRPLPAISLPTMQVRRLTPVECERLQGFPDGYTNIPWRGKPESPDGPRYKALGNSWAVPVVRWIGRRIANALA